MAREYPLSLTYEEIAAVRGALLGIDAEYGLSGAFYDPPKVGTYATTDEHRAAAGAAQNAAAAKAEGLLAKVEKLAANAAELEPDTVIGWTS